MPAGLRLADRLPEPMFTPSTKADRRATTRTSTSRRRSTSSGRRLADAARDICLALYARGAARARRRPGLILADTKFELGLVDGELVVCDEIVTPGLLAALAGRGRGSRRRRRPRSTSSRCATGPRRSRWDKRPPPAAAARRGRRGDLARATWPPTSGSPGGRWPTGTVPGTAPMRFDGPSSRCGCARASPTPRAPPSSGRCRRSGFDDVAELTSGRSFRFEVEADDEAPARAASPRLGRPAARQSGDRGDGPRRVAPAGGGLTDR